MLKAYRDLRNNSQRTKWSCAKFQIWTWCFNLKHWPKTTWLRWKVNRFVKKNPKAARSALNEMKRLLDNEERISEQMERKN